MTAFDIYAAVGGAGEDILEESEIMSKKKIIKFVPMIAAAACFAVFAAGLTYAFRSDDIEHPVPETADTETEYTPMTAEIETETETVTVTEQTSSETTVTVPETSEISGETTRVEETVTVTAPAVTEGTAVGSTETENTSAEEIEEEEIIPKWEDMDDLERYIYLDYSGNTYGITMEHFDESELIFLRNGEIFGIDEYTDKKYSMGCAVYEIDNISPDYMVAVLTADGLYTGFKRERFWYDTLGEAVEGTGILNRGIIGDIVSTSDDDARQTTEYTVPNLQQAMEKLLTSAPDTAAHINPPNDCGFVSYRVCGRDGKCVLTVYETGYVYFGAGYFNPGAEYAGEFIEYVKQNAADVNIIPYDAPDPNNADIPE